MTAADFVPPTKDLDDLTAAAKGCQGCDLFRDADQTVFGEGARSATMMLVGEQPDAHTHRGGGMPAVAVRRTGGR